MKKKQEIQTSQTADYYIEDGKYVFTAHFLKNRGYCCKNGCRHCPYPKAKDPAPAKTK